MKEVRTEKWLFAKELRYRRNKILCNLFEKTPLFSKTPTIDPEIYIQMPGSRDLYIRHLLVSGRARFHRRSIILRVSLRHSDSCVTFRRLPIYVHRKNFYRLCKCTEIFTM